MQMDQLNGLLALKAVSEARNFTAAAKTFDVSASAISQTIKQLEKRLGVALLARTTRSTSLTQAGEQFLREAGPALDQILHAIAHVGSFANKPSGLLRLNMPKLVYVCYLAPIVASFLKKYPEVSIELCFDDRLVDVVSKGYDAGIRLSDILANDVTVYRLAGPVEFVTAASTSYLKKGGRPKHPGEFLNHSCICPLLEAGPYDRWEFEEDGREFSVQVKPAITMNDSVLMLEAAAEGLGVVYTTKDAAKDYVGRGKLEVLLPQYAAVSTGFFLYYSKPSHALPKLRAFIDHVKRELSAKR